ncbi:hypothetical protein [Pseudotenacibaculum haliotis]|uniref:Fibronectin type-III domain-containing protein n=1 Tax=Pseudotenacibaculum haliotis TaxID=1862138 RepID=A0ABW5LX84_9FLAO
MKKVYLLLLLCFTLSCEAVFVEDISDDSVMLQAPTNNSQVTSGNIVFTWQLVDQAEAYQVQIATPDFQNASQIVLDSITDANSVSTHLDAGTYEWRVKAMNSEYETPYSAVSFTVN